MTTVKFERVKMKDKRREIKGLHADARKLPERGRSSEQLGL